MQVYGAAWSPDSTRIVHLDVAEWLVYLMRLDGTDREVRRAAARGKLWAILASGRRP